MKIPSTILLLGILVATAPILGWAHHGSASYDNTKPVTLVGTVTEFQFIQPHPIISLDVRDDSGNVEKWSAELTSPNHIVRYGWNPHKLKPGDRVCVAT